MPPWRIVSAVSSAGGPSTADISGSGRRRRRHGRLRATGRLPLSLAQPDPSHRGSVFGSLAFDLRLSGPPTLTALTGSFRSSDARYTLPTLQTALENVAVNGQLSGGRGQLFPRTARWAAAATMTAQGTVDLTGTGLPAAHRDRRA